MKNEQLKTVALMALAVIFVGGGMAYWQYGARSEAQARLTQLHSQLPDADQVNADLVKSQADLQLARLELEHLEKALPETAYIPTLLKELEMLGTSKNVKIVGIRPIVQGPVDPKAKKSDEAYESVDIDITGQGTYRSILEFISALKGFPKILAVTTIAMVPRQDAKATGSGELDATIRLRAFVFKQPLDENGLPMDPAEVTDTPGHTSDGSGQAPSTGGQPASQPETGAQPHTVPSGQGTHPAKGTELNTHTTSREGAL